MSLVLAEKEGSADLEFEVRLPPIAIEEVSMTVQMGQDGTSLELRDPDKTLLLRLDGHQLDRLHRDGRINVARPDTLKKSVFEYWTSQRAPVEEPKSFRFIVQADDTVEQLIGKVKLLLDFLVERKDLACHVRQVSQPMDLPEVPQAKEPEKKSSQEPIEKPKAQPASEKSSPQESQPQKPVEKPEVSREGHPPASG